MCVSEMAWLLLDEASAFQDLLSECLLGLWNAFQRLFLDCADLKRQGEQVDESLCVGLVVNLVLAECSELLVVQGVW